MANAPKLDPRSLLGMREVLAAGTALQYGIHARVVSRDKVDSPITEEWIPNSLDLEIENGVVVGVRIPQKP